MEWKKKIRATTQEERKIKEERSHQSFYLLVLTLIRWNKKKTKLIIIHIDCYETILMDTFFSHISSLRGSKRWLPESTLTVCHCSFAQHGFCFSLWQIQQCVTVPAHMWLEHDMENIMDFSCRAIILLLFALSIPSVSQHQLQNHQQAPNFR